MRAIRMLFAALLGTFVLPAHADQFQYMTLEQATRAMSAIGTGGVVQAFCAPCDDEAPRSIRVTSIGIGRVWEGGSASPYESDGQTFWELTVNDESIDLAYLYIRRHHRWENLALLLGLDAVKVPRFLGREPLEK
jgi:hypothetical protein